jgi:hypothetical protein
VRVGRCPKTKHSAHTQIGKKNGNKSPSDFPKNLTYKITPRNTILNRLIAYFDHQPQ